MVERYADHKILRARFTTRIDPAGLKSLGTVIKIEDETITLEVPRAKMAASAAELLRSYPVADLNIEEVAIDDIVRRLFTHG